MKYKIVSPARSCAQTAERHGTLQALASVSVKMIFLELTAIFARLVVDTFWM